MVKHIGITINYTDDIIQFYQNILMFSIVRKFNLDLALSISLFNIEESPEVYLLNNDGLEVEAFISNTKESKAYSHIYLEYVNADTIYNKAIEQGYRAVQKQNRNGGFTYFISDKSGNIFEIKKMAIPCGTFEGH